MAVCRALAVGLVAIAAVAGVKADASPPIALPAAVSNNAVAFVDAGGATTVFSFAGLMGGKTGRDVTAQAFSVNLKTGKARVLPPLPDGKGRLASVAAHVRGIVYIFGGYTVGDDGAEDSTPDVFAFDTKTLTYRTVTPIPVAVDDSVALTYQDRFVYLISGWHNDGNVATVQIYDAVLNTWARANDYPGEPVFGHAGGIAGRTIVVFGGVTATKQENGRNKYAASNDGWYGEIDPADPKRITWTRTPNAPGTARYRIAATGSERLNAVVFAGATNNPYNFNGIGYDKTPSVPSPEVFAFDVAGHAWRRCRDKTPASMDHRGLIEWRDRFYTVGGMIGEQRVTGAVADFAALCGPPDAP